MTVTDPIRATAPGFTLMPEQVCPNLTRDVCWRFDDVAYGGRGYAYIASGLRDELRTLGVSDEQLRPITVDNPPARSVASIRAVSSPCPGG